MKNSCKYLFLWHFIVSIFFMRKVKKWKCCFSFTCLVSDILNYSLPFLYPYHFYFSVYLTRKFSAHLTILYCLTDSLSSQLIKFHLFFSLDSIKIIPLKNVFYLLAGIIFAFLIQGMFMHTWISDY